MRKNNYRDSEASKERSADRVAVEVYPPESQLVDDADLYHLWVLPAGFELPFGLHGATASDGGNETGGEE